MRLETILNVKNTWLSYDVDKQIVLIGKYLEQQKNGNNETWVEFMVDEILRAQVCPVNNSFRS